MGLTGIAPTAYITDTDPSAVSTKTVSSWFTDESSSGVPEANIGWMMAQGWTTDGSVIVDPDTGDKTFNMKRRQVNSEVLLQALVNDYTTAYNEGRTLNDSRYDEIVTLYALMQTTSQTDWQLREAVDFAAEVAIRALTEALDSDYDSYESNVDDLLDNYGVALLLAINTRFDNQLTTAAQDLTNRGMYNSTVWTSVSAGIERERTLTLADAGDKITDKTLNLAHTLHAAKSTMRSKMIEARERLWTRIQSTADSRLSSRNTIMTNLLMFMERRTDSYPSLAEIGKLATALGAGNAAGFQP